MACVIQLDKKLMPFCFCLQVVREMAYSKTITFLVLLGVMGLLVMWNLRNQPFNHRKFFQNSSKPDIAKSFRPTINRTKLRILYGDGSCGDNPNRKSLTKILKWWIALARENNISYSLTCGSLLGAFRTNDIIPWDHDLDILIAYHDILKLDRLAGPRDFNPNDGKLHMTVIPKSQHNISMDDRKRYTCRGKESPKLVDQCSIQEPLVRIYNGWKFLDVFNYFDDGSGFLISLHENQKDSFRRTDIFPLKPCSFMGLSCTCANKPKKVLQYIYGADFETPKKKCKSKSWV